MLKNTTFRSCTRYQVNNECLKLRVFNIYTFFGAELDLFVILSCSSYSTTRNKHFYYVYVGLEGKIWEEDSQCLSFIAFFFFFRLLLI